MRPGQNRRVRGRTNNRKGPNPLTRSYESNGPDVKIRGTAQHIAEKYTQLARDAQVAGDPVACESLLQHAEHYFRLIAAAQAQYQQTYGVLPRSFEDGDEGDGDDDFDAPASGRMPQGMPHGMNQANAGDDAYPVGIPQPGNTPHGGYRDRQDRPERQERPQRNDRYDRQDRPARTDQQDRPDRQERAERPERQDRSERPARPEQQDRPERQERPEQRPERPVRVDSQPRSSADSGEFRPEGDREPRGGRRERFRRDRDTRPVSREPDVAGNEVDVSGALPAFLTTPLRPVAAPAPAPAPVEVVVEEFAPAPVLANVDQAPAGVDAKDEAGGDEGGDRFPVRARRRRGRPRADGAADATDAADSEQSAAG